MNKTFEAGTEEVANIEEISAENLWYVGRWHEPLSGPSPLYYLFTEEIDVGELEKIRYRDDVPGQQIVTLEDAPIPQTQGLSHRRCLIQDAVNNVIIANRLYESSLKSGRDMHEIFTGERDHFRETITHSELAISVGALTEQIENARNQNFKAQICTLNEYVQDDPADLWVTLKSHHDQPFWPAVKLEGFYIVEYDPEDIHDPHTELSPVIIVSQKDDTKIHLPYMRFGNELYIEYKNRD